DLVRQPGDPCRWVYIEDYPFTSIGAIVYQNDTLCSGTIRTSTKFRIDLLRSSGEWTVVAGMYDPPTINAAIFSGEDVTGECEGAFSMENLFQTASDSPAFGVPGRFGTVTFTI